MLESIDLSWCSNLTSEGLNDFSLYCVNLRYFVAKGLTKLKDEAVKNLAKKCPKLEHVSLHSCVVRHNLTAASSFNNVLIFVKKSISDEACVALANNCHELRFLCVSNCISLTDQTLSALGKNCEKLKILEASACANFSDNGFIAFSKVFYLFLSLSTLFIRIFP